MNAWHDEDWSRGILLGIEPDPNSGYRASVWFDYTRALFNEIREGSLLAVRNFSDRPRDQTGSPTGERRRTYEEYSILQIDQIHPWHYAIQGPGEKGYPAFTEASAENARQDWTEWDESNRDDVSKIRCEAIPLRTAFVRPSQGEAVRGDGRDALPDLLPDRSKPMPGFEVYLLRPEMTDKIINRGLDPQECMTLGEHVVQREVDVLVSIPEMLSLHFGVFGFTGSGKSNLVSNLVRRCLCQPQYQDGQQMWQPRPATQDGRRTFRTVIFDLMDEYTGLLIDQLVQHRYSRLVIAGREAVDDIVFQACVRAAETENDPDARDLARQAAEIWSQRITLPDELRPFRDQYIPYLRDLILDGKVRFFETGAHQGTTFDLDLEDALNDMGAQAFDNSRDQTNRARSELMDQLQPIIERAEEAEAEQRDNELRELSNRLESYVEDYDLTATGREGLEDFLESIEEHIGSRGEIPRSIRMSPIGLAGLLNQSWDRSRPFHPSLAVVIGESESHIAQYANWLIENTFQDRREESILYPRISFVFDEADVFINRDSDDASVIEGATLLARRGRKFGMGLGISTQRIRYLDTSIMAQPHTYFISKLPRKSDREAVAEAFAISEESLEQTFDFTAGQWLIASHDATGIEGTPFPVQLPNANASVAEWMEQQEEENQPSDDELPF